ncbi:MAG: cyclophilin-like fold protein [Promethearchaeota archaeon]
MSEIEVKFEIRNDIILKGILRTVMAPRTINRILALLPIVSRLHVWKEEAYFEIKAQIGPEKATKTVKAGVIAYWPQGDAVCLFFNTMLPISKVNPIGKLVHSNYEEILSVIKSGMPVKFLRTSDN